jgi:hypothetical protein
MINSFGACPQCSHRMRIEVMACWRCGTTVQGRLAIPVLATLPTEQAEFIEHFLLANGSLSQVQKVLGCSYPKVRRLLNDTMAGLRAELEAGMREKDQILAALEEKKLEGAEAVQLLRSLVGGETDD